MIDEAISIAVAPILEQVRALFDALDVGSLDVDDDGCFSLSHGEEDALYFQILPGLAAMKCTINVGHLPAVGRARAMRSVLEQNLSFVCADTPGTLSVMPTGNEVYWNSLMALDKAMVDGAVRPLTPQEFQCLLDGMTGIAQYCRQTLIHSFEPVPTMRPTDLA